MEFGGVESGFMDRQYRLASSGLDILDQEFHPVALGQFVFRVSAIGEVTIRIRHEDQVFSGHAANTDIVVASTQAYLNALNRLYTALQGGKVIHPQKDELEAAAARV